MSNIYQNKAVDTSLTPLPTVPAEVLVSLEQIAESGIAVELSTAGLRKPVGEIYPDRAFLEMVVEAGNPIALSSDAHARPPRCSVT